MKILLIFAILATSLIAIRAQCISLMHLTQRYQILIQIKTQLEKRVVELQTILNSHPNIDPQILAFNASIAILQQQPCQVIVQPNYNEIQWTLKNELSDLLSSAQSLKSNVANMLQEANMALNSYQHCFNQLQVAGPPPTCPTTPQPPPNPPPPTSPPQRPHSSCADLGFFAGITTITLPGGDPLSVLCDSQTAGPGWLVIQNRFDGSEDFYRSWAEYRNGFGSLNGEFFLGLENIYRLTSYQRHELYIYVQTFSNDIYWARYDNFYIGSEFENYRLKSVGKFEGMQERLSKHVGKDFSTYDRENSHQAFSQKYRGGYWYYKGLVKGSNLNGKYFRSGVDDISSMHWFHMNSNRATKMLIRPVGRY
ncbi:ficolin-2-like [Drosophila navojoa]|uniref:ficolin-2-like n=1 Tax=Drosophila navojoa TaxID=7232 RepID=UPI0008477FF8|nr:ficolin-2-like [Drosophila navojoa]